MFLRSAFRGLAAVAVVACADRAPSHAPASITLVDDAGDTVRLAKAAQRVISLVPSATETMIAIGFCIAAFITGYLCRRAREIGRRERG